jgi:hypothetical protein
MVHRPVTLADIVADGPVRLALSARSCPIRAQVNAPDGVLPRQGVVALFPEKRKADRAKPTRPRCSSEWLSTALRCLEAYAKLDVTQASLQVRSLTGGVFA